MQSSNDSLTHSNPLYTVSVIVPAYNSEDNIAKSIESLQHQTLGPDKLEIVLVNDGSSDGTSAICHEYAGKASNIVVIDKENGGVGSARNAGIDAAHGKYIAFLDSDDTLLPNTLEAAASFFDAHYDEIDAVSYPMRLHNAKREWSHVREEVMTHTGIYDLAKLQYAFALITNVNVVVKNDESLPRFREDLAVHEDELFFLTILLRKQKVGFCKEGAYRYQQLPGSAIGTKMHPFYQFEKNIGFWEELFAAYPGKAPLYLQASFLNEVNWKIKQDVLFPYHYAPDDFHRSMQRIAALMDRVDDDVIFTAPRSSEFLNHYFLTLKPSANIACAVSEQGVVLRNGDRLLLCRRNTVVELVRTRVDGDTFKLKGAIKSVAFGYCGKPTLTATIDGNRRLEIPLHPSSLSRHMARIETSVFWGFDIDVPLDSCSRISFTVRIDGYDLPSLVKLSARASGNTNNGIDAFSTEDYLVSLNQMNSAIEIKRHPSWLAKQKAWLSNSFGVARRNPKGFAVRSALKMRRKPKQPTWLYYDRTGVGGDNAYFQFLHDFEKQDGILRFYVTDEDDATLDEMFEKRHKSSMIRFSSTEHKFLHLQADRIVASYIERPNWCPFQQKALNALADMIRYDLVYLQHGVLHAHMPWKYSADRLLMDYEVVSTPYETKILTDTYGFLPEQLLTSGMPRYDRIDAGQASKRKILFAPSWRKYLVTESSDLKFGRRERALLESSFWRETKAFLADPRLSKLLEEHEYELDIKLHPIFKVYNPEFERFCSKRIHLVNEVSEGDYRVFVTDYSSWVFDFVYLKRAVVYFLPDEVEFKAGLNGYRELDLPLEEGFGPLSRTGTDLLDAVASIVENEGRPAAPYRQRMEGFFFHYDNNQRERLYDELMRTWEERKGR
ncbi:bifunctional glycosyltransferase/CDP-glycerol:glycerophosphate glycerophosphotransferase [Eggerthella timonensis]|uniref:bifunctional glycosyltransferase/CDP-glycerol:glycerophosphate glycerophosphotransferase n=1 Tax=Eggerthella timonensis TaxID=1871008 RepID=UPI000C77C31A|nr:glycosyltransferase [Eggerthella timonensis]